MKLQNKTRSEAVQRRFEIGSAGDAWEVHDEDGRPVTGAMSYADAFSARDNLNEAALNGKKALRFALGAVDV